MIESLEDFFGRKEVVLSVTQIFISNEVLKQRLYGK